MGLHMETGMIGEFLTMNLPWYVKVGKRIITIMSSIYIYPNIYIHSLEIHHELSRWEISDNRGTVDSFVTVFPIVGDV